MAVMNAVPRPQATQPASRARAMSPAPAARPMRIVAAWLRPSGTMKAMLASCSET